MALTVIGGVGLAGLALFLAWKGDDAAPSPTPPDPVPWELTSDSQTSVSVSIRPAGNTATAAQHRTAAALTEAGSPAPAFNLRMTSMTRLGPDNVVVGVEDRLSRKAQVMRIGDHAADGWRLAAIDFDRDSADFEQNGTRLTVFLEKGDPAPLPASETEPRIMAVDDEREVITETARRGPQFTEAFSNRVLKVEGSTDVAVSGVAHAPDVVEVKTLGTSFALRREIAENILKLDTITPEQKLLMLLTYPGATTVEEGQDPARQAAEAEASLAATLASPPEEKPETSELDRLIKEMPDIEPPPVELPKAP